MRTTGGNVRCEPPLPGPLGLALRGVRGGALGVLEFPGFGVVFGCLVLSACFGVVFGCFGAVFLPESKIPN